MKEIEVVAAILIKNNTILATRRGYGDYINLWEFPGGKIEPDETKEAALRRELREELKIEVAIKDFLCTINYDYPAFHLTMHCFIGSIAGGELTLVEHNDAAWLSAGKLHSVEWLPADLQILDKIKTWLENNPAGNNPA